MIHKKILSLLVLLMTAASGAWATVYSSGAVYTTDLKVGDVIIYGASIHNKFKLAANRYEYNGSVQTENSYEFQNMGLGTNGSLSGGYTPVTADGQDGNAWVVLSLKAENSDYVMLGGIIYDPNSVYPTTDAQKEGDFFTEATFNMPDYDATVGFDIVRDMNDATYPVEFAGIPEPTTGGVSKIVVKKNSTSGKFEFLNDITIQLIDNISGTDVDIIEATGITIKVLKGTETSYGAIEYDQENPIKFSEFLENTEPGYYWIKAVPTDETTSPYIGTVYSYEMLLIKGYEVEVPAKEMITYYKDENLTLEESENNAQLYTVSDVSGTTVTLSDAITIVPANTAMLVYNPTDVTKTFLLIPTEDDADAITPYAGFKGTNEDKAQGATGNGPWRMAANTKYYGCNGNDFVWIKNAGNVDAHRCWIEISTANAPSRLTLVFEKEGTTDIDSMEDGRSQMEDGAWYDLSGRKLDGEPTAKGVYIKDGKKVVVR